jgi:hypothetical protein
MSETTTTESPADPGRDRRRLAVFVALAISLIVTVPLLWLASRLFSFPVDLQAAAKLFLPTIGGFQPEPMERFLYMLSLLLFPAGLAGGHLLAIRHLPRLSDGAVRAALRFGEWLPLPILAAAFGGLTNVRLGNAGRMFMHGVPLALLVVTLAGLVLAIFREGKPGRHPWVLHLQWLATNLPVPAVMVLLFLLSLFDLSGIKESFVFQMSFNAFFHSMGQVWLGRELLVDLPNQYGLYPHFLEPLFRLIGFDVFRFTAVMGTLLVLAVFFVHLFLRRFVENRLLATLGLVAMVSLSLLAGRIFTGNNDHYFQYYPLRFFFPALSLWLGQIWFARRQTWVYWLSLAVVSVGVLWNFDTGAVAFLAWILVLTGDRLIDRDLKGALLHAARGVAVLAVVIGAVTLYLAVRYGHVPDYSSFFTYQRIFYLYGFNALPLPLFGYWYLVAFVYLVGLARAIGDLVRGTHSPLTSAYAHLSLLGCGLFSYYQGRSHPLVLLGVLWPASILVTMLAEEARRTAAQGNLAARVTAAALVAALTLPPIYAAFNGRILYRYIVSQRPTIAGGASTPVIRNAEFIRQHTKPGERVFILSYLSGVYHLESRTVPPLNVPGASELFLRKDYERIAEYIESTPRVKVVIDLKYAAADLVRFLEKYRAEKYASPDGGILIYVTD